MDHESVNEEDGEVGGSAATEMQLLCAHILLGGSVDPQLRGSADASFPLFSCGQI